MDGWMDGNLLNSPFHRCTTPTSSSIKNGNTCNELSTRSNELSTRSNELSTKSNELSTKSNGLCTKSNGK